MTRNDDKKSTLFALLHLCTTFDNVNHCIFCGKVSNCGLRLWFNGFMCWSFMVILSIGNCILSPVSLSSVALFFSQTRFFFDSCAAPVANVHSHGTACHYHANGIQLFLSVDRNDRKLNDSLKKKERNLFTDFKTAAIVISYS